MIDLVQSPPVIQHVPADDAADPGAASRAAAPRDVQAAPLKVVRIIARLNVGGPARHCLLLGEGLRAHGFETLLLTGDLDEGEEALEDPQLRGGGPGFRIERVPGLGRPPAPRDDLRALWRIVRVLRRERPAIVHTHTAKAGALGRVAAALAGVPVVVHTFHGHVLSGYFSPAGSLAVILAERALSRLTSRIVTLSPRLRDELASRYRVAPRERFEVVPLGRDLTPFARAERGALRHELGLGDDALLVGCVGRLVPIKQVPLLVQAFAEVARREPRARLVIVGDGPDRPLIEAALRERGLSERAHLLGWRQDLPAIYADLDLLALSSRNEGTPLAMIEAFAAGVPAIATRVGGVPDLFAGDETGGARAALGAERAPSGVDVRAAGALVPPGDAQLLAEALILFAARPDLRRAASAAARDASQAYAGERLIEATAALYRRLLAGPTERRRARG